MRYFAEILATHAVLCGNSQKYILQHSRRCHCVYGNTQNFVISLTQYYGSVHALPYGKRLVLMRQYEVFRVIQQAITIELLQDNYSTYADWREIHIRSPTDLKSSLLVNMRNLAFD